MSAQGRTLRLDQTTEKTYFTFSRYLSGVFRLRATVLGQMKQARGFRHFLLRGLNKVRGEWKLVCLTHNVLASWRYRTVLT